MLAPCLCQGRGSILSRIMPGEYATLHGGDRRLEFGGIKWDPLVVNTALSQERRAVDGVSPDIVPLSISLTQPQYAGTLSESYTPVSDAGRRGHYLICSPSGSINSEKLHRECSYWISMVSDSLRIFYTSCQQVARERRHKRIDRGRYYKN